jgi:hypothetical protein
VEDWSSQLLQLMREYESHLIGGDASKISFVDNCIVANGGFFWTIFGV